MSGAVQHPYSEFQQWLDRYKDSYTKYRTTGDASQRTIYEKSKAYLDDYLAAREQEAAQNTEMLKKYVEEVAGEDPTTQSKRITDAVANGPKQYDELLTSELSEVPTDYHALWVKGGIAAAVLGVAGIIGFVL